MLFYFFSFFAPTEAKAISDILWKFIWQIGPSQRYEQQTRQFIRVNIQLWNGSNMCFA